MPTWTKRAAGVWESDNGDTVNPRDNQLSQALGTVAYKLLFDEKLSSNELTLRDWARQKRDTALEVICTKPEKGPH